MTGILSRDVLVLTILMVGWKEWTRRQHCCDGSFVTTLRDWRFLDLYCELLTTQPFFERDPGSGIMPIDDGRRSCLAVVPDYI
jgi:hypothetical protein